MILTISGAAGTGKSTVVSILRNLMGEDYRCLHSGNVFREWARRCGLDVREFALKARKDSSLLFKINSHMQEYAAEFGLVLPDEALAEREPDHKLDWLTKVEMLKPDAKLIVEGRSGAYVAIGLGVNAFNVRLVAHPRERARRVVAREGKTIEEQLERIQRREEENRVRFRELYGCDLDRLRYHYVQDTTDLLPEVVAAMILGAARSAAFAP